MRAFFPLMAAAAIALIAGCSSPSDGNKSAGIEIGNPSLAFSAHFVVDYNSSDSDFTFIRTLSKTSATAENSFIVDDFHLNLTRLSAYSSYYIYVNFDVTQGLLLWPVSGDSSESVSVKFSDESSATDSTLAAALGDLKLDGDGLLKEIGLTMKADPDSSSSTVSGSMFLGNAAVPFEFRLSNIAQMELRYHRDQLVFDSTDSSSSLTVRFHVPAWVSGLDLSGAVASADGIVRFDSMNNVVLWDSLSARFLASFSCVHWITTALDGTTSDTYAAGALARYDVIDSNWVTNGQFLNGGEGWNLVQQLNGAADTAIVRESETSYYMRVSVKTPGLYSYSVQLIHEDIPVLQGRKYKLVFTAVADSADSITVRLGSYSSYETVGFQKHIFIDTLWMSHEVEYTGLVNDPFARLEFNLGSSAPAFRIKDVKIYRID